MLPTIWNVWVSSQKTTHEAAEVDVVDDGPVL